MRESIGTTWIFQLAITFTLLFAAYIALTINYSKSFKVKNEVLSIIERSEGLTNSGLNTVNSYLLGSAYNQMGNCPTNDLDNNWKGAKSLTSTSLEDAQAGTKYYYCVAKHQGYNTTYPGRTFYNVRLFFKFDLPVIGQIFTFNVDGQTSEIDHVYD